MRQILLCAVILLIATGARAEDREMNWDPLKLGAFPISFWCAPPADFTTLERYEQIRDAGFTFVMPSCHGNTVERNLKVLDLCEQLGMKAVVADPRMVHAISGVADARDRLDAIVAEYSKHPALAGYYVVDEPGAGAFAGLAEVVAYLRERDPDHPAVINLFPNYASPQQLGTATYEEHVRKYAEIVKPAFISYDHYHFLHDGDRPGFVENLETVRRVSLDHNLPFWNIVLVTKHGPYRNLTEGELRYQAMQTLAYGGKGLLWFTYWSPEGADASFEWRNAMINADGSQDAHYEMVQQINREVQAIGSELLEARSLDVVVNDEIEPHNTVGLFRKGERRMALVASNDYREPAELTIHVQAGAVETYDPSRREWTPYAAKPVDGKVPVALRLDAGGAQLIRWR